MHCFVTYVVITPQNISISSHNISYKHFINNKFNCLQIIRNTWTLFNILIWLCNLLPHSLTTHFSLCHIIFHKPFPYKHGQAERVLECLSWATSHDVEVKSSYNHSLESSSLQLSSQRLCVMTSPLVIVSSLCWRQASVLTQVHC